MERWIATVDFLMDVWVRKILGDAVQILSIMHAIMDKICTASPTSVRLVLLLPPLKRTHTHENTILGDYSKRLTNLFLVY